MMENMNHISVLHRYRKAYIANRLKPHGALSIFPAIILALEREDGINQERLTFLLKQDKTSISNALRQLQAQAYVTRRPCQVDRRSNLVFLTDLSYSLLPRLHEVLNAWEEAIWNGISEEHRQITEAALAAMAQNALEPFQRDWCVANP